MTINIFEGARRIGRLVAVLWIIGVVVFIWIDEPRIEMGYMVEWPGDVPKLVRAAFAWERSCLVNDAQEDEYRTTTKGTNVRAVICFRAQKSDDGRMFVPYRIDRESKKWWGGDRLSTEVGDYKRQAGAAFNLSRLDEDWADSKYWPARWNQARTAAAWIFGGLVFLWAVMWTAGWIMRGFLGIPRGQDRRPE